MLRNTHSGIVGGGGETLEPMGGDLINRCQEQHLAMSMLQLGLQEEPANGPQSSEAMNQTDPEVNDEEKKKMDQDVDG